VENIEVAVNLEDFSETTFKRISVRSPDPVPPKLNDVTIEGQRVSFTIPRLDIYSVIVLE
jgi:hypothetical protein